VKKKAKAQSVEDLDKELQNLWLEMAKEKGKIKVGGFPENPKKIKNIRRNIARLLTKKTILEKK
jgi:ribosomal protein L29